MIINARQSQMMTGATNSPRKQMLCMGFGLLVVLAATLPLSPAKADSKCASIKQLDMDALSRLHRTMTKKGGYVIVFRHAEKGRNVAPWGCEKPEESLTRPAGHDQARKIGAAFDELKIPVGEVRASPYCRTLETAHFAFGRAIRDDKLSFSRKNRYRLKLAQIVRERLARPTNTKSNTVLVTHSPNLNRALNDVTGSSSASVDYGEAVIFDRASDTLSCVARVRSDQWRLLKP